MEAVQCYVQAGCILQADLPASCDVLQKTLQPLHTHFILRLVVAVSLLALPVVCSAVGAQA